MSETGKWKDGLCLDNFYRVQVSQWRREKPTDRPLCIIWCLKGRASQLAIPLQLLRNIVLCSRV